MSKRLHGIEAIEKVEELRAALCDHTLSKYADPTEGARHGLLPEDAREIAREDPGLIWWEPARPPRTYSAFERSSHPTRGNFGSGVLD